MKITKEELLTRINKLEVDDEIKVSLMEDIDDSMDVNQNAVDETILEQLKSDNEDLKFKYEELLNRYKERFLTGTETEIEEEEKEKVDVEEVIDVTEI